MLPLFISLLVKSPYGNDRIFASFRWNPKYKPSVKIKYVWSHPCEAGFHRKRDLTRQRWIWLRVILNREDFNFLAVRRLFIFQGGACAFLISKAWKIGKNAGFCPPLPIYTFVFRKILQPFIFIYKKFTNLSKNFYFPLVLMKNLSFIAGDQLFRSLCFPFNI